MKIVIVGVASFVVALAVGTGVRVMTAPAPKLPAAADSTAAAPNAAPAAQAQPVAATSTVEPVPGPAAAATHGPNQAPAGTSVSAPATAHGPNPAPAPGASVSAPATAHGTSGAATAAAHTAQDSGRAAHDEPSAADEPVESYRNLAKILASMKPTEAGKIMSHFSDDQVEGLLRATSVRQAAVFLAQLPTERAAVLGKRLMIERPAEEKK
jgi:hypothetical protein